MNPATGGDDRGSTVVRGRVGRRDIEAKLGEIRRELESTTEAAKPMALAVGAVVVVALLAATYLLGQRRGRKKTTIVEVRRV